ncbi:MAG: hypothetical protein JJE30_08905 [Desulfuromonadales bacterium]|nr:hypothetical protein [Desulfuromonadales bacterium]
MAKFKPGETGNKNGRPPGTPDKRSQLREQLQSRAGDLVTKCVEMALAGDSTAMRICMERLIPGLKAQSEIVTLDISGEPSEQAAQVVSAAISGTITPDAAEAVMRLLAAAVSIEDMTKVKADIKEIKAILEANKKNEEEYQWRQQMQQQHGNSKKLRK